MPTTLKPVSEAVEAEVQRMIEDFPFMNYNRPSALLALENAIAYCIAEDVLNCRQPSEFALDRFAYVRGQLGHDGLGS